MGTQFRLSPCLDGIRPFAPDAEFSAQELEALPMPNWIDKENNANDEPRSSKETITKAFNWKRRPLNAQAGISSGKAFCEMGGSSKPGL